MSWLGATTLARTTLTALSNQIRERPGTSRAKDLNPATVRNWVEDAERADGLRPSAAARSSESEELRALRTENAELRRANEILKTASALFAQAELDRRLE